MRKIHMMTPLLLVLCMLIMMPLASAKMVQVSDLGAYRFVERMNFWHSIRMCGELTLPIPYDH